MIGLRNSRHFFVQSEVKPKPIVTRSRTFSRASCRLRVFTLSFDWFNELSLSSVIGQNDYFGLKPITKRSILKPKQTGITFDTHMKIAPVSGCISALFIKRICCFCCRPFSWDQQKLLGIGSTGFLHNTWTPLKTLFSANGNLSRLLCAVFRP